MERAGRESIGTRKKGQHDKPPRAHQLSGEREALADSDKRVVNVRLFDVSSDAGEGLVVLGLAVDKDVTGDRTARLPPGNNVQQRRFASACARRRVKS